ncbi:MAG: dephospho-CoA kinase [Thermovirga sp.]
MLVVGLTGDVGAGKSTLSSIWGALGAQVIDADAIVADIWKSKDMISLSVGRWGKRILSNCGQPDHAIISGIVFDDDDEYRWICDTLHPRVRAAMSGMVERLDGWLVAEIPLLFENGVPEWIDLTVYIEAPADIRLSRNRYRGWGPDEIMRREHRLMRSAQKRGLADFVVTNDGSFEDLSLKAQCLARRFLAASSIIKISIHASSWEESRLASAGLKDSALAADISTSVGDFTVSAFVREACIGEILFLLGNIKLLEGLSIDTENIRKVPRHVLFWAMESAEN